MQTFDCLVDTTPMAESVNTVNASVATVGIAVTAMEAAVVKTEHEASDTICGNINKGFFLLMRSQVSQKLATNYSIVNSKLMSMAQIAKSIDSMRSQMENDFQMIKRRYMKLFHQLDKELDTRIRELDKPVMDIASMRTSLITNRIRNDSAAVLFYGHDSQIVSQLALSARLKHRTNKTLAAITNNAYNSQTYSKTIVHMMENISEKENTQLFFPVLCTEESSMFASGNALNEVYLPDSLSTSSKTLIENQFMQNMSSISYDQKTDEEKTEIKNAFLKQLSESGVDQRTADTIMKLYNGGTV
jgi:hypothetical protein